MLYTELGEGRSVDIDGTKLTIGTIDGDIVRLGTETKLDQGRSVDIAGAVVTVVGCKNNKVRLGIDADKSVKITHERKNHVHK